MSAKSEAQSIGAGERIYLHIYDYETKEFSGLTTYHGLVRIYNSNTWPSRIFWCVVVLSCLSLFMIHSGYLLLGYHSKPTLFQVNTIVAEDGLSFPEITICNYNPIKTSELTRYNMTPELLSYILMAFNDHVDDSYPTSQALFEDYVADYSSINNRNFSIAEFFKEIRPTCEDIRCCANQSWILYKVDTFSHTFLCQPANATCSRFPKSKLNKTQYLSGSSYGWQFVLDGNNARYPDNQLSFDMGFRVLVHEPGKEYSMEAHGLSVPSGAALYAGISVKNISLLQRADWGYCQQGWDPKIHGELLTNLTYTATHCEWNCLAREWLATCGCLPMKLLPLKTVQNFPICAPLEINMCADTVYANSTNCSCDVECQLMEYEMQMSYADIITGSISRRFMLSEEYVENNISVVNLFMQRMAYERHEQQKQLQTADLLSNIAGSMGLFLGMSTVTLLEIFIYLFKSVWGTVNTERQKQFMEAMLEEENERRQSLVIVEEPQPEKAANEEEENNHEASPRKRPSRRVSIAPMHIHVDRRGSVALPLFGQQRRSGSAQHYNLISPRKSLAYGATGRRGSTMETTIGGLLPNFQSPR
ncbi:Amiloride-sensitive sodium channel [Ancylostoma caninum]|uniref:Amiloride-sensitive sodium channel n=1 Tax=Ancylostoma caninum TaxID=29170 RepID=A0A368GCJ1_ANCCA|nr:Amiloride-sensitive sodium channel [Ancylostoma caninum]